jgi:very-short-patch-repair endonuclease
MPQLMFYGARKSTFLNASRLRGRPTKAEHLLWQQLRKKQILGLRFKPQHPIASFIVDFYCHRIKLAIEVDGEYHNAQLDLDENRTYMIIEFGVRLIRFRNEDVFDRIDWVVKTIEREAELLLEGLREKKV